MIIQKINKICPKSIITNCLKTDNQFLNSFQLMTYHEMSKVDTFGEVILPEIFKTCFVLRNENTFSTPAFHNSIGT